MYNNCCHDDGGGGKLQNMLLIVNVQWSFQAHITCTPQKLHGQHVLCQSLGSSLFCGCSILLVWCWSSNMWI